MKLASAAINLLLDVISGKETQERTVYIKPQLFENKEMVL